MDFKFNAASWAIADFQNEEDVVDSDDYYAKEKATAHTDLVRVIHMTIMIKDRDGACWRRSTPSRITTGRLSQKMLLQFERVLHHFLHHVLYPIVSIFRFASN